MGGLGVVFSTSLRICEKCDFEQHSIVFTICFIFESDFGLENAYFSVVLSKALFKLIFFDLGNDFWSKSDPK